MNHIEQILLALKEQSEIMKNNPVEAKKMLVELGLWILKGDVVFHHPSGLYFRCENQKQERWMNMNPYYQKVDKDIVPNNYFEKY